MSISSVDPSGTPDYSYLKGTGNPETLNDIWDEFYDHILEKCVDLYGPLPDVNDPNTDWVEYIRLFDLYYDFLGESVDEAKQTLRIAATYVFAFFPNPEDQIEMVSLLEDYTLKCLSEPGEMISKDDFLMGWYDICEEKYLDTIGFDPEIPIESNYDKTQILFSIYRLLRQLVGELQLLTAAQTEYQNFLTKLDGAYNKAIANIPLTTDIPGASDDQEAEMKADAQMAEQRWTENLRSRQSEAQDLLKQLQTLLGQSNEATNQAGNFIAQFIQTLQGLLSSIFR